MAQRRGGSVAAPAKQKLRKNHGPKKHMFKEFKPMIHEYAKSGIFTKYSSFEAFAQSCSARGIKTGVQDMWMEFKYLPRDKQDEYLTNLKENSVAATNRAEKRRKAANKAAK